MHKMYYSMMSQIQILNCEDYIIIVSFTHIQCAKIFRYRHDSVLLTNAIFPGKLLILFKISSAKDTLGMLISGQGLLTAIAGY